MVEPKKLIIKNESELERYIQAVLTWHNHTFCKILVSDRPVTNVRVMSLEEALEEEEKYKKYAKTLFQDSDSEISKFMAHLTTLDSIELGYIYDYSLWRKKIIESDQKTYTN